MRPSRFVAGISLALAVMAGSLPVAAQVARDFSFSDEQGHRILRFSGTSAETMTEDQRDEIVNAEFSRMVHDRIRADIRFDREPVDGAWAEPLAPKLAAFFEENGPAFDVTIAECRSQTCRLILEHDHWLGMSAHIELMDLIEQSTRDFLQRNPGSFEHVFLVTAYGKDRQTPNVKVFLTRASDSTN